jgi:ornithine decarboxylase
MLMLLLINLLLFFLGMFMEALAIMVLTVPVLMPVVTQLGIDPARCIHTHPIKRDIDIRNALHLGVRIFVADNPDEVRKFEAYRDQAQLLLRVSFRSPGAVVDLSRKFGCDPEMAVEVLDLAKRLGLEPCGISFHVGSQQRKVKAWDRALAMASTVFRDCAERGINLTMVNMGGGFPTRYLKDVPPVVTYGRAIFRALRKHFGNQIPETIIEPGRGMVGNAGIIETEVVLISRKSDEDEVRWVYLDIGKFGGLAETMDESIRYAIRTPHDGADMTPCVLAGPTCDSADVLYEKMPYPLPVTLEIGDKLLIEGTGAYTSTYSSVAFNGIPPLKTYHI